MCVLVRKTSYGPFGAHVSLVSLGNEINKVIEEFHRRKELIDKERNEEIKNELSKKTNMQEGYVIEIPVLPYKR